MSNPTCRVCQRITQNPDAIFCEHCGAPLPEVAPQSRQTTCPACHRIIPQPDAAFCRHCGARLPEATPQSSQHNGWRQTVRKSATPLSDNDADFVVGYDVEPYTAAEYRDWIVNFTVIDTKKRLAGKMPFFKHGRATVTTAGKEVAGTVLESVWDRNK